GHVPMGGWSAAKALETMPAGSTKPPPIARPALMKSRRPLPPEPELRSCMTSPPCAPALPAQFVVTIQGCDARAAPADGTASCEWLPAGPLPCGRGPAGGETAPLL